MFCQMYEFGHFMEKRCIFGCSKNIDQSVRMMVKPNPAVSCILWLLALSPGLLFAQTDDQHWNYIKKYSKTAVSEMYFSKVPASITMAQALHESRFGTSELAVNANNHFGIKCQSDWTGKRYTYQDDDNNNCFRWYDSVSESYRDHSKFLMTRPRYAFLFTLNPTDYVGWAQGLKQAGYATNPQYARILIRLIEDYKLFLLDTMQRAAEPMVAVTGNLIPNRIPAASAPSQKVFLRNRVKCTVVKEGDNIATITSKLGYASWEIRKYNEIGKADDVIPGQLIYLQPKRSKAESAYHSHTVKKGESMYDISQLYGIKLKCLYWRNRMVPGTQPRVGQEIWLRGRRPVRR